jgi:hypothetical protein
VLHLRFCLKINVVIADWKPTSFTESQSRLLSLKRLSDSKLRIQTVVTSHCTSEEQVCTIWHVAVCSSAQGPRGDGRLYCLSLSPVQKRRREYSWMWHCVQFGASPAMCPRNVLSLSKENECKPSKKQQRAGGNVFETSHCALDRETAIQKMPPEWLLFRYALGYVAHVAMTTKQLQLWKSTVMLGRSWSQSSWGWNCYCEVEKVQIAS